MSFEQRTFKACQVRSTARGGITGYAAIFNQLSDDLGGFRERILPGAFSRCLGSNPDVRCLFNHDRNIVLGRTKSRTLRLDEDATGLRFDVDIPDTSAARDLRESVQRGDIDQCSFGFSVVGQNWLDGGTIRELTDVDVLDVSPCTFAAYPQTTVTARELFPEGVPSEVRDRRPMPKRAWIPVSSSSPSTSQPANSPVQCAADCKTDAELLASLTSKLSVLEPLRRFKNMKNLTFGAAEQKELRTYLQSGNFQKRDLTTGGAAGAFIPEAFNGMVFDAMKSYDAIFSDDVSTILESATGAPMDLFALDDTESAATIVGEAASNS